MALVVALAFGEAAAGAQAKPKTAVSAEHRARLQALQAGAVALRTGLASDPGKTFDALSSPEQLAIADAVGPGSAERGVRLTLFMAGASLRIGEANDELASVGYYNPFADTWLVTRWTRLAGAWTLQSAAWMAGPKLRPPTEQVSWLAHDGPWGQALVESEGRALAGFDQRALVLALAEPGGARFDQAADAYRHIDTTAAALAPWAKDPAKRGALVAALTALHARHWSALGHAGDGQGVRRVPAELLSGLTPVAAVDESAGSAVLLASPKAPEVVIAAEFDGAAKLQSLTVLDLVAKAPTSGATQ